MKTKTQINPSATLAGNAKEEIDRLYYRHESALRVRAALQAFDAIMDGEPDKAKEIVESHNHESTRHELKQLATAEYSYKHARALAYRRKFTR